MGSTGDTRSTASPLARKPAEAATRDAATVAELGIGVGTPQ